MKYFRYLRYVFRHKWFVLVECWKKGLILPGVMHDWTKFLPGELVPYANHFYGSKEIIAKYKRVAESKGGYSKGVDEGDYLFDRAWLFHIHRNPHHWQHWLLYEDEGDVKTLPMPLRCVLEMVCDWVGAGRAQGRKFEGECKKWYRSHKDKMVLHPETRRIVEMLLGGEK